MSKSVQGRINELDYDKAIERVQLRKFIDILRSMGVNNRRQYKQIKI